MATKKSAVKKRTITTEAVAKKATSPKASTSGKAPAVKMKKTLLFRYMAEQMNVPPKQVARFLSLLIETAASQTKELGQFIIPGLGKLVKAQRGARMGINPITGESIKIIAKTTVRFRIAKAVKDAVVPPKR